ncbi:hypothetical protein PR048_006703 [Dryococelus australis]|uniref:Uncharacterized protein n=1 Tax=Dryococelus australis TaxID=614101 RepID=A0ABQ9IBP8_9NEOP|nr:hypothetical protein PR048_006703 [Dryococelus australis]
MVNFSVSYVSPGTDPGYDLLTGCGKLNHFANSCRVKTVQIAEKCDSDSTDESLYCYNITKCVNVLEFKGKRQNDPTYPNEWLETIKVENKKLKVKLDNRAQVSV